MTARHDKRQQLRAGGAVGVAGDNDGDDSMTIHRWPLQSDCVCVCVCERVWFLYAAKSLLLEPEPELLIEVSKAQTEVATITHYSAWL